MNTNQKINQIEDDISSLQSNLKLLNENASKLLNMNIAIVKWMQIIDEKLKTVDFDLKKKDQEQK